jgi:hypothetical protein
MNVLSATASYISGYLPDTIKDAAGLSPQISEDVRHITWSSIERVVWPPDPVRQFLVVGYQDGFQVYDMQDPANAYEVLSKQAASAVLVARLLPAPLLCEEDDAKKLGAKEAPMLAYIDKGAPARVKLFSMRAHDDVSYLRLTEPAKALQASRRFFAVGLQGLVELYDVLKFEKLFSVQCAGISPTFALGDRWIAYNLPPQQPTMGAGASIFSSSSTGGVVDYVKQVGQRTFDNMFMIPPDGGSEPSPTPTKERCGVVALRDATSKAVIAQFEDHIEPVESMVWDTSGLQLISAAASGHCVLVHRALIGADVRGEFALGGIVFQHLYTLYRGCTPAIISDITVSDDGQQVAVSSAKGTTHVFRLPPLHSADLGHYLAETGDARLAPTSMPRTSSQGLDEFGHVGGGISGTMPFKPIVVKSSTRVKLGSIFLAEGLMPQCGFVNMSQSRRATLNSRPLCSRICVASRMGTLALYALSPSMPSDASPGIAGTSGPVGASGDSIVPGQRSGAGENSEWQATLTKEVKFCRPLQHFRERRYSQIELMRPSSRPQSPQLFFAMPELGIKDLEDKTSPWTSPLLQPLPSPRASPHLGPKAMPSPRASPHVGPRASPRLLRSASPGPEDAFSIEPSKWLSQAETTTYAPSDVPIWHCPQLAFQTYPACMEVAELNATLRSGNRILNCKELVVSRPERPSDRVHCDGVERLPELFVGALGSTVDDSSASSREHLEHLVGSQSRKSATVLAAKRAPALVVAPAWGSIRGKHGGNLEQEDGIGSGLEDLEEDWVKA